MFACHLHVSVYLEFPIAVQLKQKVCVLGKVEVPDGRIELITTNAAVVDGS